VQKHFSLADKSGFKLDLLLLFWVILIIKCDHKFVVTDKLT